MCTGVALALRELPEKLVVQHRLADCVHDRGGEQEVRFLYRHSLPRLPVWREGQLQVVRWGNGQRRSRSLPATRWTRLAAVESGEWQGFRPEFVDIPASAGLENGIWYKVRRGMRGLLVCDERYAPVVYVLCEPASHYYQVMTRSPWMPLLIGERI
jgi:hypothetical protein